MYYNNRGNAWNGLNEFSEAKSDYSRAIVLQPNFAAPYFNLYSLYIKSNKTLALYNPEQIKLFGFKQNNLSK